jgi:Stage II sporulation protein E (SpoIIE)
MSPEPRSRPGLRARLGSRWRSITRPGPQSLVPQVLLVSLALVIAALLLFVPQLVQVAAVVVPLLLGSLFLNPRQLPPFVGLIAAILLISLPRVVQPTVRTYITAGVVLLLCFLVLYQSFRRSRLGVAGAKGEAMLIDLRDRIQRHGQLPALPSQWTAESALRSAGGTLFAGDFIVASSARDRLDVAVVDVSGKGDAAATRALLLSGAFGGLIAAIPPHEFMTAANAYLLRHNWDEGFATAVQVSLDLTTGHFEVWTAGHPPAVHLAAGSGRWAALPSDGPVLGLIDGAEFESVRGVMRPGDAMILYTDGLVETPRRDIELGIDRLIGEAEKVLHADQPDRVERLVDTVGSPDDDRALLLIHRR